MHIILEDTRAKHIFRLQRCTLIAKCKTYFECNADKQICQLLFTQPVYKRLSFFCCTNCNFNFSTVTYIS